MKTIRLSEDSTHCLWCAKNILTPMEVKMAAKRETYIAMVCSAACEQAATRAFEFVRKAIPRFLIGLFVGLGLVVGGSSLEWGMKWLAAGVFVIGLTVTLWPMVTPQTVEILGMKRAFVVGRVLGVAQIIMAIWLAWRFS